MPTSFYQILTRGDRDAIVAYLRTLKADQEQVPAPVYKMALPHHLFPARRSRLHAGATAQQGQAWLLSRNHRALHGMPYADGAEGKGGFCKNAISARAGVSNSAWTVGHFDFAQHHVEQDKGIGDWSDDEIKNAITHGVRKDGTRLKPPMGIGYYASMTDADLDAIVAYLRTVPAKE